MGRFRASWFAVLVLLAPARAAAWVITEHEDLTALGLARVARLEPRHGLALQAAWAKARAHAPWADKRLCADVAEKRHLKGCLRFAMLPALAADHSCSPPDLQHIITEADWLDGVAREAAELRQRIRDAKGEPAALTDLRNTLDIRLQLADRDYAGRAEVNTAHYQLARRSQTLEDHLRDALAPGETSNGTALFATYHAAALAQAELAVEALARGESAGALVMRAFVTESFALHFLEDAFAAGHAVGSWGDAAQRKGTHDYYNRYGFEVTTWLGESYVAHGDIFATAWDERAVARGVAASLRQFAEVLAPFGGVVHPADAQRARESLASIGQLLPDGDFDACVRTDTQPTIASIATEPFVLEVWQHTPKPPRRVPGIPRFRLEFGPFFGLSAAGGGSALWGTDGRPLEGELRGRLGIGGGFSGDGMFSQLMTGRVFAEFVAAGTYNLATHESAAGIGFRVHAPYTFVPGDFIIGVALGFGPPRLAWMVQQAALGGFFGLNAVVPINEQTRFQFVGGRELSMVWYFPRGLPPNDRKWRYEVLIPAFEISFLGGFHQEVGSQWTFDLGLELNHEEGQPFFLGPYLAGSFFGRYFP